MIVEIQGADQVAHLKRPEVVAVRGIDGDPVVFPVADPDIARHRVHRRAMGIVEFRRALGIAIPLVDEVGVFVEVQNPRHADDIGRIIRADIIGALIPWPSKI